MSKRKTLRRRTRLRRRQPLRSTTRLRRIGRRGKRLRAADRRQEQATHQLPCVCGCPAGPGEITRAHLIGRVVESVRNEDWNNLPACWWLHRWLDSEPDGIRCKRSMWALAVGLGRRLEAVDVRGLLEEYDY